MEKCNKCHKNENFVEGILCKLLLIKPWEIASKSQNYIHYYLLFQIAHTTFSDGRCCYNYIFIPTTSNLKIKNKYWLKINDYDWYQNKEIQLKLDEIFILQDFDLRIWKTIGEDYVCDHLPQMIIKETSNEWKLEKKIFKTIWNKLYFNFSIHGTMFFILNRNRFQTSGEYFQKKLKSKFIYQTDAFIPEFNNDINIFFNNIINITNDIRVNKKFNNNFNHIKNYEKEHFINFNDKNIESKKIFFKKYFKDKIK
ncbi:MAG: hypothetical protein ACRDBR_00840 [Metamycoplasmataceae bacterium]